MVSKLPYYVCEVPAYEAEGQIIKTERNGDVFFIPVEVASKIVAALNRAIDQCYENRGAVVRLRPDQSMRLAGS